MIKLKVKTLKTWQEKLRGLNGSKIITPVYFETRFGIHTFGLTKPIDVIILDSHNHVADMCIKLNPGKIFFWNPRYFRVVELPSGKYKISLHDTVKF